MHMHLRPCALVMPLGTSQYGARPVGVRVYRNTFRQSFHQGPLVPFGTLGNLLDVLCKYFLGCCHLCVEDIQGKLMIQVETIHTFGEFSFQFDNILTKSVHSSSCETGEQHSFHCCLWTYLPLFCFRFGTIIVL